MQIVIDRPDLLDDAFEFLDDIVVNKGLTFSAHFSDINKQMQTVGEERFRTSTSTGNDILTRWKIEKKSQGFPTDNAILTGQTKAVAEFKDGDLQIDTDGDTVNQTFAYTSYVADYRYPFTDPEFDHPFWRHRWRWQYWKPSDNIPVDLDWNIWKTGSIPVGTMTSREAMEQLLIPDSVCKNILAGEDITVATVKDGGVTAKWQ